ncbi:MAG: hypothetical protein OEY64_05775 [Nitrospinota bacterium]|nr:hypothetical protein [Nitrospinota bacterium]
MKNKNKLPDILTKTSNISLGEDGILRQTFLPSAEETEDTAKENVEAMLSFINQMNIEENKRCPILVDGRNIRSITKSARNIYQNEGRAVSLVAAALLGGSKVSMLIGNFFIGFNRPNHPIRLFTSEEKAIEWLEVFK